MTWVLRDDFPRSRRGWDREAVRDHLREVEAEMQALAGTSRMSGRAAEGVRRVVQAAEETLAELVVEAQHELERAAVEAEEIRAAAREEALYRSPAGAAPDAAAARRESEEIVRDARERASSIVAQAEAEAAARMAETEEAVGGLLAEATEMGRRVERFGDELERGFAARGSDGAALGEPGLAAARGRRFQPGGGGGSIPPAGAETEAGERRAQAPIRS